MIKEMNEYGLLPSDALIVATCRQNGIKIIITRDQDFKHIKWLKIEYPRQ